MFGVKKQFVGREKCNYTMLCIVYFDILPYSWKYWQEVNLVVGSQIATCIGGFKFGGLVQDRHTYLCQ